MEVKHDLIASVTGPGWRYGLSRILIDEKDRGAVFVAGSQEPIAVFEVTSLSTSRGTGTTDGGEVTWRRRGSSCQYKLAKCKVTTATMTSWWEASLAEPEPETTTASYPEGEPSTDWKVGELKAYAADNDIDLDGASRKADMVEVISPTKSTADDLDLL